MAARNSGRATRRHDRIGGNRHRIRSRRQFTKGESGAVSQRERRRRSKSLPDWLAISRWASVMRCR